MVVGLTFVDGILNIDASDVRFWYTQHTFPVEVWAQQPNWPSARGRPMQHFTPRPIVIDGNSQRLDFFATDVFDGGGGIVFDGTTRDSRVFGFHI